MLRHDMVKLVAVVIGFICILFVATCGGEDNSGFPQPKPGLDSSEPHWVIQHSACGPDGEPISIKWISSDYHDTDLVSYDGEVAAWADGELCVRGRIKWDHVLGRRAGLTIRAQGQFIHDNFDWRQWLSRKAEDNEKWQKFVIIVVELPEKPKEAKLSIKLYSK